MRSPFCFRIGIGRKQRIYRRILYIVSAAALSAALAWGLLTVYVNSHNIVYSEQISIGEVLEKILRC